MTRTAVEIRSLGEGTHQVVIDGVDMSGALSEVNVNVLPGPTGVTITLHLRASNSFAYSGNANVELDVDSVSLLQRLGWHRPA